MSYPRPWYTPRPWVDEPLPFEASLPWWSPDRGEIRKEADRRRSMNYGLEFNEEDKRADRVVAAAEERQVRWDERRAERERSRTRSVARRAERSEYNRWLEREKENDWLSEPYRPFHRWCWLICLTCRTLERLEMDNGGTVRPPASHNGHVGEIITGSDAAVMARFREALG